MLHNFGVGRDDGDRCLPLDNQLDAGLARRGPGERDDAVNHMPEIDGFGCGRNAPGKPQEPLRDRPAPEDLFANDVRAVANRLDGLGLNPAVGGVLELVDDRLRAGERRRQRRVHFVRQARRQDAERGKPLDLGQMFFLAHAVSDVAPRPTTWPTTPLSA